VLSASLYDGESVEVEKMAECKFPEVGGLTQVDNTDLAVLILSGKKVAMLEAIDWDYDPKRRLRGATRFHSGSSAEEIELAIGGKDRWAVIHCPHPPCASCIALYQHLRDLGYEHVAVYVGGANAGADTGPAE